MNIVVTRWSPLNIDRARGAWKCPRQHIFYGFLDCHFIFSKNFSLLVCGDWRRGAISTSDCVIWCRYCKHLCLVKWTDGFFFILDRKCVREFPVIISLTTLNINVGYCQMTLFFFVGCWRHCFNYRGWRHFVNYRGWSHFVNYRGWRQQILDTFCILYTKSGYLDYNIVVLLHTAESAENLILPSKVGKTF